MKHLLAGNLLFIFLLITSYGISQNLSDEQQVLVETFVTRVKGKDWANLSESVMYPIKRNYPVPSVENKTEFMERCNDLFDEQLVNLISSSKPDSNWKVIGKAGIRLNNGDVWLDLEGNLKQIDYQTTSEKEWEEQLIEEDRNTLPVFLQKYDRPVMQMDAGKWILRIDQVKGNSYRMVGWLQGVRNPNRDAVEIIPNGFLEHIGGGGNKSYTFTSEKIGTFVCYVTPSREGDTPEGKLEIFRDGELIRSYPAVSVKY